MSKTLRILKTVKWSMRAIFMVILGEFAFYGIFRCPFAVPYVGCESCPVIQCPGRKIWLSVWIGILGSAILFGRAFCGYACPAGTFSDILAKFKLVKIKISRSLDKYLSFGKYIVLAASLIYLFLLSNPRWAIPIRTGEFFQSVDLTFQHADNLWIFRTIIISVLIILSLVIPNIWCRYFCATGGILELFNKISIFKIRKSKECNFCNICKKSCSMDTLPQEQNCTNCGECVDDCSKDLIHLNKGS
jgi:polyferredoxin